VRCCLLLFFWCNLYFSIKQWQRSAQERERLSRAEADAREAKLNALRYQLNPHFLFNSLSALSTLVQDGDGSRANRMIEQIADLLRASLAKDVRLEVALSEEMAFSEQNLAVEQTRMGERLQVQLAISPETLDASVPTMLLQPLVENAIRHGVAPLVGGGRIAIHSHLVDAHLQIVIQNSGDCSRYRTVNQDESRQGIGIANTVERLEGLYGADYRFDLQWLDSGDCEVTLELPFRKVAKGMEPACAH
jgi:two-component system sensor histidine kinase AlgZ